MLDTSLNTETITDINMVRYLMGDAEVRVAVRFEDENAVLCDRHHFAEWTQTATEMPKDIDGVRIDFEFNPAAKLLFIGRIYG